MRNSLAVVLLIILIPTVIIFDKTVGTTFGGLRLMIAGIVLGYFAGYVIVKQLEKSAFVSTLMQFEVGGVRGILIAIVASFVVILSGLVNRHLFLDDPVLMETEVIAKESDLGGKGGSNWIVIVNHTKHGQLSLRARHAFWESVTVGDRMDLKVRKSLVGFPIVFDFEGAG